MLNTIDTQIRHLTGVETYARLNRAHMDFLDFDVNRNKNCFEAFLKLKSSLAIKSLFKKVIGDIHPQDFDLNDALKTVRTTMSQTQEMPI